MKRLPKSLKLLGVFYFCVGFALVFKLMTPVIEAQNTHSVENVFRPYYEVLAFTEDDVHVVELDKLAAFQRQNPEFSFRLPEGREKYFVEKLNERGDSVLYTLETQPQKNNKERQIIRFSYEDFRTLTRNTYEATDKELFPKTAMRLNMRFTPLKILVSTIGGTLVCLIFLAIYRKSLI
jgi:hypothetical protein